MSNDNYIKDSKNAIKSTADLLDQEKMALLLPSFETSSTKKKRKELDYAIFEAEMLIIFYCNELFQMQKINEQERAALTSQLQEQYSTEKENLLAAVILAEEKKLAELTKLRDLLAEYERNADLLKEIQTKLDTLARERELLYAQFADKIYKALKEVANSTQTPLIVPLIQINKEHLLDPDSTHENLVTLDSPQIIRRAAENARERFANMDASLAEWRELVRNELRNEVRRDLEDFFGKIVVPSEVQHYVELQVMSERHIAAMRNFEAGVFDKLSNYSDKLDVEVNTIYEIERNEARLIEIKEETIKQQNEIFKKSRVNTKTTTNDTASIFAKLKETKPSEFSPKPDTNRPPSQPSQLSQEQIIPNPPKRRRLDISDDGTEETFTRKLK